MERFPQGQPLEGREPWGVRRIKRLRIGCIQTDREQYDEVPERLRAFQRSIPSGNLDPCDETVRGLVLDSGPRVVRQVGSGAQGDHYRHYPDLVTGLWAHHIRTFRIRGQDLGTDLEIVYRNSITQPLNAHPSNRKRPAATFRGVAAKYLTINNKSIGLVP